VRSASYVSPVTDPIRPPIKGAEWSVNPLGGMGQFERLTARQKGAIGLGPSLAGGGMPRGTGLGEDPYGQRLTTGNLRRNGQIIINNMVWFNAQFDPMQEPNLPALTPQQELDELARARAQAASSLERARPGAGGGGGGGGAGGRRLAPEGQFMVLRDFVAKDVAIIDKQNASIRAEMTEAGIPIREPQPDPLAPEAQAKPPAPAQEP
jgi:hypothetical protein